MLSVTPVRVSFGDAGIDGELVSPANPKGLVLFAHGSGSSRRSPRNLFVAHVLQQHGFATLLIDLLTEDIHMLAGRLVTVVEWLRERTDTASLPSGLFGASTGGGAALVAAAAQPTEIAAVVSRGGRPDLAGSALPYVEAPTLLIVGGRDTEVIRINRDAMARMRCEVVLEIVPGASHLFEEAGALDHVAALAATWFERHLIRPDAARRASAEVSR
jgi:putative phosphoribosyl transferase